MEMSRSRSQDEGASLYIVSTGPGDMANLTPMAREAIESAEVIIGNRMYLDQMSSLLNDKVVISSAMGKEVERAKQAVRLAKEKKVAMLSGGDAGVYGMASIILEVAESECPGLKVKVVPGVTAATAAASLMGSPLSGDFVVISLSDLLTPHDVMMRRADLAFQMGVPVAIYNPKSRNRPDNLREALTLAIRHAGPDRPVGIVRNAYREGQSVTYTTLGRLLEDDSAVDMHSIVIVGGEGTRMIKEGDHVKGFITPRGYHRKYVY
ncbi:MAG: precorrin-3B C(17)-methyltransferase [Methanomassiliicoccales archaeon]|nr:MAG: precorrin-3B C(17)-methyltransferase [Methanomassiliicoccales archaeon]